MNRHRKSLVIQTLAEAQACVKQQEWERAWEKLSEAHIYSQPIAFLHVIVHFEMLKLGFKTRDLKEIRGQILRLLLAAPGSVFGHFPKGNTGRSNVSAFEEMEVPEPIRQRLVDAEKKMRHE